MLVKGVMKPRICIVNHILLSKLGRIRVLFPNTNWNQNHHTDQIRQQHQVLVRCLQKKGWKSNRYFQTLSPIRIPILLPVSACHGIGQGLIRLVDHHEHSFSLGIVGVFIRMPSERLLPERLLNRSRICCGVDVQDGERIK